MTAVTGPWERLLVEREDDVLVVTMNRPDRLNAVDNQLHVEFTQILTTVDRDPKSRVVVLTGAGRAFCSGGDIGGMSSESGNPLEERTDGVHSSGWHLIYNMLSVEKPIVAMVNGPAVGLGATIALLCDAVIMSEGARIGDRHVNVGLVAGDGGTVIWPLLLGPLRAKEFLMTGDLVNGIQAAEMGLVNRAVPPEQLREETMTLAKKLAALPPYAVRATKHSINRYIRWMANEQLDTSLAWEHLSMKMEDHHEAVAAFMEKRQGVYKGR
jgi:enoyl-CoA hydratase